ncbi:MAG: ion transporter, partial [Candidatus Margulisiibacteriota bacterium]
MKKKNKLYTIIFESDTPLGKWFDILLIFFILISVITVMLDSVQSFSLKMGRALTLIEWILTFIFTLEFSLCMYCSHKPKSYIFRFFAYFLKPNKII